MPEERVSPSVFDLCLGDCSSSTAQDVIVLAVEAEYWSIGGGGAGDEKSASIGPIVIDTGRADTSPVSLEQP